MVQYSCDPPEKRLRKPIHAPMECEPVVRLFRRYDFGSLAFFPPFVLGADEVLVSPCYAILYCFFMFVCRTFSEGDERSCYLIWRKALAKR